MFPAIGDMPVSEITTADCLIPVRKVEARGAINTAERLAEMIKQVMQHAIYSGQIASNPAVGISGAVTDGPAEQHRPAIIAPHALDRFMHNVWEWPYPTVAKPLLQLALLTFARPGEIRAMRWDEIEGDEWVYRVSKVGLERHIVPLSQQALQVVKAQRALTSHFDFVLANPNTGRSISDVAPSPFIKVLGYQGVISAHGARTTARTILVETLGYQEEQLELQLNHAPRDIHGRAYNRTQWRDERREMMQVWADWLDQQRRGAKAEEIGISVA